MPFEDYVADFIAMNKTGRGFWNSWRTRQGLPRELLRKEYGINDQV
jgi:hypothetical protein